MDSPTSKQESRATNVMWKPLPVWLFLLCLLIGSLFTMIFGWSVESTVEGDPSFGTFGDASVAVASFPDLAGYTLSSIVADRDANLRVPRTVPDLTHFRPVQMKPDIRVQGLFVRADKAALARAPAWRVLVGTFLVDGQAENAALAFSPELDVVKMWMLREGEIQGVKPQPIGNKFIHGFAILKDGSMIFTFDGGVSVQRIDRCGHRIWATAGDFNHVVSLEDDEKFAWTLNGWLTKVEIVRVATATGEIVRRIPISDIIAANPTIDILEIGKDADPRHTGERWLMPDPFHFNDVEPLPAAIADRFPNFKAGDLLLSARDLNLVFVMDPETLRVKWWRIGTWRRQHDPDWQPTGEISVLDNRTGRGYSRIVSVDPTSNKVRVLFDGRNNGFYTWLRGKHQISRSGDILITSSQQGRVFEVDPDGHMVFDMVNTKPGSKEFNYLLSEAIWLPLESFNFTKEFPCEK